MAGSSNVKQSLIAFCATALLLVCSGALAQGRFVEDIQVSKRGNEATITIDLACPMRFQSDAKTQQGILLEIRVSPLESCRQIGNGDISSEVYRPVGGQLAYLDEVEYESLGLGENLLMLHFDRTVDYRVAQRGDLRSLQLIVQLGNESQPTPTPQTEVTPVPVPATPPPAAGQAPTPAQTLPAGRAPLTSRVREPSAVADYVVNLQSTREPVDPTVVEGIAVPRGAKPYVSQIEVDGQTWYRLRLGFFATEADARAALATLAEKFPRAWVGRAETEEVRRASDFSFAAGATLVAKAPGADEQTVSATAAAPASGQSTLTPEQLQELQEKGRNAMLAQDYETAIKIYTQLLQEPGDHRAEAREYLGLARERDGQPAYAAAEYRAYLKEYPDTEGARRVQQRLNGLVLAAEAPREPLRRTGLAAQAEAGASHWDIATGLSQYYRRDLDQLDQTSPEITTLSAVFTDLDFSVRRTGGAFDWVGRVALGNMYDLIGEENNGPGNLNRVSYAYFDMNPPQGDWTVRFGRQTLHNWGVLGRFDGLHFSYDWKPDRRVHFVSGFPVESTRYGLQSNRQFNGVAVDFDHLVGAWDFSTFLNNQTIEGIADRQAAGFEVHYLDDKRTLTTMVDYDYQYGELNMALALGTWRFDNRLILTGLVDKRKSPVLTTRNALIGQLVTTIDDLLSVWTEDEIHQMALDRTADSTTVTIGMAKPLFERFQINADVTMTEIGATVDSFGALGIPSTGQQVYYSASFVGSGLFGKGDVSVFNVRHGVADDFTTSQLTWDARFPVGRRLRLNPRLRLAVWDSAAGVHRETASPSFRLLLNMRNRYRFELEVGSDELLRTDLSVFSPEQKSTGNYVNIGYRADF